MGGLRRKLRKKRQEDFERGGGNVTREKEDRGCILGSQFLLFALF
jgi:hypothetical protein